MTIREHSLPQRVLDHIDAKTVRGSGCWVMTYSVGNHGYHRVQFMEGGQRYHFLAHRVAWARAHGPIAVGADIHHHCFNRRCVNPDHLTAMDGWQNKRRTLGQDWPLGYCKRGHPDSEMVRVSDQKRRCGPCLRAERARATKRWLAKQKREKGR